MKHEYEAWNVINMPHIIENNFDKSIKCISDNCNKFLSAGNNIY